MLTHIESKGKADGFGVKNQQDAFIVKSTSCCCVGVCVRSCSFCPCRLSSLQSFVNGWQRTVGTAHAHDNRDGSFAVGTLATLLREDDDTRTDKKPTTHDHILI